VYRRLCIENGAEYERAYMIFGPAGLDLSNGSPASGEVELEKGMFIRIDGQPKYQGYICNLSRIVGFGEVSDSLTKAHEIEKWLVERCMEEMKPGMKCSEIRQIELDLYDDIGYPPVIPYTGHGVGRVVHEPPYLSLNDHTVLQPNMVETLEPTLCHSEGGDMFISIEDQFLITNDGIEWLTEAAPMDLYV
jgi:Xaa-Pro aminopeptidase